MIKKINEASRKSDAKIHNVTYRVVLDGCSGWGKYDDLKN